MNTIESQLPVFVESPARRLFTWTVRKLTSRHGRRILFITSLYFQIVRIEQMRQDVVSRLNDIMALAKSEKALQLPIAIRGIVWRGSNLTDILSAEELSRPIPRDRAQAISERIVDRMPRCLAYSVRREMIDDVLTLLQNGALLAKAA